MRRAMDMIDATYREVERHPNELMMLHDRGANSAGEKAK